MSRTIDMVADLIDPEPVPAIFGDRPVAPVQREDESAESYRIRQREFLVDLADWKAEHGERVAASSFLQRYEAWLRGGR